MKVIVGTNETSAWPHFGGSIWVRLQYVLGLERLGIESFWVDRLAAPDARKNPHSVSYLVQRFHRVMEDFGLDKRYCIVLAGGERYFGMSEEELAGLVEEADLLLNVSGYLPPGAPLSSVSRRVYLDVDPGFTQIWADQVDMHFDRHDVFFSTGQNVGGKDFPIPTGAIEWQTTLPPVVLDLWPPCIDEDRAPITSIGDWRGSQDAIYQEEWYGGKREEFLGFLRVPLEAEQEIELALLVGQDDYEDLGVLKRHGWRVHDPYSHTGDPHSYREFIQSSRAEFSVAKRGYVRTNSGWISDRTACYLASGKPAIVQATGPLGSLPVGEGLLTFRTVQQAVDAVRVVEEDYLRHAAAARQLAEQYFDSDRVLASLLERAGL